MSPTNFSGDSDDSVCVEHRYGAETAPSMAIVRAIAVIEDVDPMESPKELGIRLYDHLDPAALDQLLSVNDGDDTVRIDLTIHTDTEYSVRVRDSGHLIVEKVV